jgi:hypothetical protein
MHFDVDKIAKASYWTETGKAKAEIWKSAHPDLHKKWSAFGEYLTRDSPSELVVEQKVADLLKFQFASQEFDAVFAEITKSADSNAENDELVSGMKKAIARIADTAGKHLLDSQKNRDNDADQSTYSVDYLDPNEFAKLVESAKSTSDQVLEARLDLSLPVEVVDQFTDSISQQLVNHPKEMKSIAEKLLENAQHADDCYKSVERLKIQVASRSEEVARRKITEQSSIDGKMAENQSTAQTSMRQLEIKQEEFRAANQALTDKIAQCRVEEEKARVDLASTNFKNLVEIKQQTVDKERAYHIFVKDQKTFAALKTKLEEILTKKGQTETELASLKSYGQMKLYFGK